MKRGKSDEAEISILEVQQGRIEFCILGKTPLILNRMSEKVQRELLMPKGKKSAAEKAANLKHVPLEEYRASVYRSQAHDAPTRLLMLSTAFKGAMRSVAVDIPGAAKAQIGRLTYVNGDYVSIFGTPKLFMSVTRSADMNRTPDIRTRAIVPEWACSLSVTYVKPILREQAVVNLLAAAGIMRGVGDWRPEKGSGNYGQFELVSANDPRHKAALKQGIKAQDAALETPGFYDAESEDLFGWFIEESVKRGFPANKGTVAPVAARANGRSKAIQAVV